MKTRVNWTQAGIELFLTDIVSDSISSPLFDSVLQAMNSTVGVNTLSTYADITSLLVPTTDLAINTTSAFQNLIYAGANQWEVKSLSCVTWTPAGTAVFPFTMSGLALLTPGGSPVLLGWCAFDAVLFENAYSVHEATPYLLMNSTSLQS